MNQWAKRFFGARTYVEFKLGSRYVGDWSEPWLWCKENLHKDDYDLKWLEAPGAENLCDGIDFVNKEDAVAFKLRFGI
jgi:hypothetical protein